MKIAFRADAGLRIGTGHVMRCLTLARELAGRGHDCRFISRELPGNMNTSVAAEFPVISLPAPTGKAPSPPPAHAAWAGVDWPQDAAETRAAVQGADWLVMDHYAFDVRWQRAARPSGTQLMVIDDLADRHHECDLLLDQNLGRHGADYDPLLPARAERLIGPRFALLRPEFAAKRMAALSARANRAFQLRHLLIAPGGMDSDNTTGAVLDALRDMTLPEGFRVTVSLGATAPHLDTLRARQLPFPCRVLAGSSDMAGLMAEADLAIGAAGGSAWERCAQGLPTLLLLLAENQRAGTAALVKAGAALALGQADGGLARRLHAALAAASEPETLAALSRAAAAVTDGRGTRRVADAMAAPLHLRPATQGDAETVWNWRAALPAVHFRAGANPDLPTHLAWFDRAMKDPNRLLLMAGDSAHLRLDIAGDSAAVSILIAPEARGHGLGLRLLALLEPLARAQALRRLTAEAAVSNPASLALFRAAGYDEGVAAKGFIGFSRLLHRTAAP